MNSEGRIGSTKCGNVLSTIYNEENDKILKQLVSKLNKRTGEFASKSLSAAKSFMAKYG